MPVVLPASSEDCIGLLMPIVTSRRSWALRGIHERVDPLYNPYPQVWLGLVRNPACKDVFIRESWHPLEAPLERLFVHPLRDDKQRRGLFL